MASDNLFRTKAPGIMALLMQDFALDEESAAAILGNLGHESGGFQFLQEKKPLVPGSAGGWGWAQWTGSRRTQFESYVRRNGFDPASDTANYKWLFIELKGSESRAIPAVKNADGLEAKVKAFELAFERAHKDFKHYESRNQWAQKALDAFHAGGWEPLEIEDAVAADVVEKTGGVTARADVGANAVLSAIIQRLISALLPALAEALTGKPLDVRATDEKPVPVETVKQSKGAIDLRAGILGVLGSLGLSAAGVVGAPVGPEATMTGMLLPLATGAAAALGIPAPIVRIVGGLFSGFIANRKKP